VGVCPRAYPSAGSLQSGLNSNIIQEIKDRGLDIGEERMDISGSLGITVIDSLMRGFECSTIPDVYMLFSSFFVNVVYDNLVEPFQ
jgi:hypothetical protein